MVLTHRTAADSTADIAPTITKIAEGDERARDWFYRRYADTLFRRARFRYRSDRHIDPEELLQDLFVWCLQNDAKLLTAYVDRTEPTERTEFRLEGYLWGLVGGLVSNQRRARRRNEDPVALENVKEPSAADFEAEITDRDAIEKLTSCVKRRGARLYLYFLLRYLEGLTPEEIRAVTGWHPTKTYNLKTALNQAVKACVRLLGLG